MLNKILVGVIIIVVIAFVGFLISGLDVSVSPEEENIEEHVSLAKEWIYDNSLTFKDRGGSNLEHVRTIEVEKGIYEIVFTFDTSFDGYGVVEEGDIMTEVVTSHTVVVTVKDDEIISVVTDEMYDEKEGQEIEIGEQEEEFMNIDVYFVLIEDNQEKIVSVQRTISLTTETERAALLALISGPTAEEVELGYSTSISNEVVLKSLYIEDGVAHVDFSSELDVAGGSAIVTMIRAQIEKTLLQFEIIDSVEISIEGITEDILQP